MVSKQDKYAITAKNVSKHFGKLQALKNVNLTASRGKVTGLLGPNGAGKSTLIRVMTTLLEPNGGEVYVDGVNVLEDSAEARKHLGLAGQFAAVDDFLTGRETLEMVARLYHMPRGKTKARAKDLLEKLGLTEAADRQMKSVD